MKPSVVGASRTAERVMSFRLEPTWGSTLCTAVEFVGDNELVIDWMNGSATAVGKLAHIVECCIEACHRSVDFM